MTWNNISSFTVGQKLTAALANQIGGDLNAIGSAWTAYTPVWTSSGTAPVLGNGVIGGSYLLAGKLVIGKLYMQSGSTTTYGTGIYSWSLPVTSIASAVPALSHLGTGAYYDTSAPARYPRLVELASATTIQLVDMSAVAVAQSAPVVWASGDSMTASFVYEAQ